MSSMSTLRRETMSIDPAILTETSRSSGISWPAIFGGALAAAAVSLILLMLGSALGLSTLSPWSQADTMASFTVKTAIWLIVMQWLASGLGGYVTGRLRLRWLGLHTDEVFFRDTAHGFLAWSLATLVTATLLTSAATTAVGAGVHASAMLGAPAAAPANPPAPPTPGMAEPLAYYVDGLYRAPTPNTPPLTPDTRMETTRIFLMSFKNGGVSDDDKTYLTRLVSARTGLSPADASKRVDDTIAHVNAMKEKAKEDAEAARKTAMHVSLYIFLSLLVGAFIASAAAALGGHHRDEW